MVYAAAPCVKRQVEAYVVLEKIESAMGYLPLSVMAIAVGALGQFMTAWIFCTGVAMSLFEGSSKYLRGRIHRFFFHGMSCCQVSTAQGTSDRYNLGTYTVLGGRFRVTLGYFFIIAVFRFIVMIIQLSLGILLYLRIDEFKRNPDYKKDAGCRRVVECIMFTFACLVAHSVFVVLIIFFSVLWRFLSERLSNIGCWGSTSCRERDGSSPSGPGALMERVERAQRTMETGVAWYVHCHRHSGFTAAEAQADKEQCGLQGYWFYSVKELVNQVGDHVHDLADENRSAASRLRGGRARKERTMALESLLDLSREQRLSDCEDSTLHDETASYLQDLPQTSRCRHDVDAGRDFALAGGYLVMLQVLKCCPEDSDGLPLAASILSGFAAGLSVLTWQPGQSQEIVEMLEHEDFCCCTRQVLKHLGKLMQRTIVPKGKDDCNLQRTQRLQEALVSAICSYAHAASDIAAHLQHVALLPRAQWNGIVNGDDELTKHMRTLSNAFTTFCPLGWFLEGKFTPFQYSCDGWFQWLETVRWALTRADDGIVLNTLLHCASRPSDFPRKVVADSIRTLSSLFSPRMIYWHRFDMRHVELPELFINISSVKASANLPEGLKSLVVRCCDEDDPLFSVPVFSKLQLAKMAISQDIRDNDENVVQVLLLCLSYWRRALGAKELDWLVCETVEMLRDVVRSSHNPAEIRRFIVDSPGGLECLTLMLQPLFPRIAAIRIDTEQDTSDAPVAPLSGDGGRGDGGRGPSAEVQVAAASSSSSASKGVFRNLFRHVTDVSWTGDEQVSIRYSAPAAGLLQDIITTASGGDRETRDLLNQNVSAFLFSLMQMLMNLINLKPLGQSLINGAAQAQRHCFARVEKGQACAQRLCQHISAHFLLFVESLSHPAWHPPCGPMEAITIVSGDNIMEDLEWNVNILLGARNALRLLDHLIDSRWEKLSVEEIDLLIHRLVRLRQVPAPQLHLVLALPDWNEEIKNKITRLLDDIKPFIQGKVRSSPPLPLQPKEREVLTACLNVLQAHDNRKQQETGNRPQDEPTGRRNPQARGRQVGTGRQKQGTPTSRPPSHPLTIGGAGATGVGSGDQDGDDTVGQLSHNRRQKGKGRGRGKLLPEDSDQTRKSRSMELARKQNVSSAEDTNQGDAADAPPSGRPIL
ncbi:hypothetical protein CBR_g55434 [Chara braunii]|uniref:Uncharacterized protein n=1 Tax=Chara braunii TaxID=69332 RepID=A0A388K7S9_CHABU|nr:hypothetical protein CBR_g55434 [Chara braunii]|eukprot:GBG66091.1 hypothetical protein CBR_g55434 [Chara braunii]